MADIDTVADDVAVFDTLYLFEALTLSSHFEKPSAVYKQIFASFFTF